MASSQTCGLEPSWLIIFQAADAERDWWEGAINNLKLTIRFKSNLSSDQKPKHVRSNKYKTNGLRFVRPTFVTWGFFGPQSMLFKGHRHLSLNLTLNTHLLAMIRTHFEYRHYISTYNLTYECINVKNLTSKKITLCILSDKCGIINRNAHFHVIFFLRAY